MRQPLFLLRCAGLVLVAFLLPASVGESKEPEAMFSRQAVKTGVVARVISADTIKLESGETVRLIGIKALPAPARDPLDKDENGFVIRKETPETSLEQSAYEFAEELLLGQEVRLEFDSQLRDESFHTLAYVFVVADEIFANVEIVRNGYAQLQIRPPNTRYAEQLRQAYREARADKVGIHGE